MLCVKPNGEKANRGLDGPGRRLRRDFFQFQPLNFTDHQ